MKEEKIILGGGCFWCTEAVFKLLKGVSSVTPGYAGGEKENPCYEDVCKGDTNHAEVVEIVYDPGIIKFEDILTVFFASHDPTSLNKQGNDVGTQYRSVIFYTNEEQNRIAKKFIEDLNSSSAMGSPIVTEVKPIDKIYEAEKNHKDYYNKNPGNPYCKIIINPKLNKVQEKYAELLKTLP